MSGQGVVDDFSLEVVGVVEVERRLVVEVQQGVARIDRDGIDHLGRVGLYNVWIGVENIVGVG